jgi:hypothetical protein
MHRRLALGLIAALPLLLTACGAPAADVQRPPQAARSVTTQPSGAPASCPTTRPPDSPFVPPAPYSAEPPSVAGDKVWYGTNELWTWLDADGVWDMARNEHGRFDKSFWWRQGYDWQTETTPQLSVTGRRLDSPAPTVSVSDATNGFEPSMGAFMLLGLELPTGGCWELTGHYHGSSLRFVVWVT